MQHTLWAALHGLVSREADRRGVPQERADAALLWVQRNAFTAGDNSGLEEALDPTQLRKLTARVWSSAALFEGTDHWPCSLLQAWSRFGFGLGVGVGVGLGCGLGLGLGLGFRLGLT